MDRKVTNDKDKLTPRVAAKKELIWNKMYKKLIAFKAVNPQKNPSLTSTDKDEQRLAGWWRILKKLYREEKLEEHWMIKVAAIVLRTEKVSNNKINETTGTVRLRGNYQKVIRNENGVTPRIAETREIRWNKMYQELIVFQAKNHQKNPSFTAADEAEKRLARWWHIVKKLYNVKQLEEQWMIKAEAVGINEKKVNNKSILSRVAEKRELRWNSMYQELVAFRAAHPLKNPSSLSIDKDEQRLALWWRIVKKMYRERKLDKQWVIKVEAVGLKVKKINNKKSSETKMAEKLESSYQDLLDFIELSVTKNETSAAVEKLSVDEMAPQTTPQKKLLFNLPSQYSKDKKERKLYAFIYKMKMLYKQAKLNDYWINKLTTIGIELRGKSTRYNVKMEAHWNENYSDLVKFRKLNPTKWPNSYKRSVTEARLYFWLKSLKNRERKNKLKQEWIDKLQEIGYSLITEYRPSGKENWQNNIQKLIDFKQQNEGKFPYYKSKDENEKKLAAWLRNVKHSNKINKLAIEYKQQLENLGFSFEKINTRKPYHLTSGIRKHNDEKFNEKYNRLLEFLKKSPNRFPNRRDSDPEGKKLGIWLGNLKIAYKNRLLPQEWREKMEEIGFSVAKLESRTTVTNLKPYQYRKTGINLDLFHKTYAEFLEFRKQYPDRFPSVYKPTSEQEVYLANWIHWLRSRYKKNELPEDLIEKMQATGCRLETGAASQQKILLAKWEAKNQELIAFKATHNRWPIRKTSDMVESRLSRWMDDLKRKSVKEKIPNEWIEQLIEAGFSFTGNNSNNARTSKGYNEAKYAQLVIFRGQNPNKWPSRGLGIGVEKSLAIWLVNMKINYKKNKKANQDLFNKLKAIGYNLESGKEELEKEMFTRWDIRYSQLLKFIEANNKLPKKSTSNNLEKTLRSWMERMRRFYRLNKMPDQWKEKLTKVGVIIPNRDN